MCWDYSEIGDFMKNMVDYKLIEISKEGNRHVVRLQREVEDDELEEAKKQDEEFRKLWKEKLKEDKWLHCIN